MCSLAGVPRTQRGAWWPEGSRWARVSSGSDALSGEGSQVAGAATMAPAVPL